MQPRQLWKKRSLTATKAGLLIRWTLAVAAAIVALAVLLRITPIRLDRFIVSGASMEPTLRHSDRLLVLRGPAAVLRPRPGQIVLARAEPIPDREIVKRVAAVTSHGSQRRYVLIGDNTAASTDSRQFGAVPAGAITGRVLLRYWPEERAGAIR